VADQWPEVSRLHRRAWNSTSAQWSPSLAGPSRPQDRVPLRTAQGLPTRKPLPDRRLNAPSRTPPRPALGPVLLDGQVLRSEGWRRIDRGRLPAGTNTSNPYVLMAAGLVARNARKLGLTSKPWVKTLAGPGFARGDRLSDPPPACSTNCPAIGFNLVGYGCTTCIGNSGPLKTGNFGGPEVRRRHCLFGAVGQPQFRRSRAPGSKAELPGLAAAGGGLCAGGIAQRGPETPSRLARAATASRCTSRTSGPASHGGRGLRATGTSLRRCSSAATAGVFDGDERWRRHQGAGRARSIPGTKSPRM